MGSDGGLFGLFKKDKTEEDQESLVDNYAYINFLLSDEHLNETLANVHKIVDLESWLFQPYSNGFQYHNKSMEDAIEIGRKVKNTESYLAGNQDYRGVSLNKDVLKTVLKHFLETIDAFEFEAARDGLEPIYDAALNTPEEMIRYILEERKEKLDILARDAEGSRSVDYARRIFEYDLILQVAGEKTPTDSKYISELSDTFTQSINDYINDRVEAPGGEDGSDQAKGNSKKN